MMQETTHTHDLPEALRRRIIEYFKYKYRDGKLRNQETVLRELPYDMQARLPFLLKASAAMFSKQRVCDRPHCLQGRKVSLLLTSSPLHLHDHHAGYFCVCMQATHCMQALYTSNIASTSGLLCLHCSQLDHCWRKGA